MKRLVLVLVLALGAIMGVQAQKRWVFSPEVTLGVGFANGPKAYGTQAFTAGYKFGGLFLLGAGAGFRSALPVSSRTTVISGASRKEYILDLGVPVFLRIGLVSEYKYGGKEWDALSTSYDFGARLPAQDAETGVGDVLHGCQRHGTLSQVDGSYLHIACKKSFFKSSEKKSSRGRPSGPTIKAAVICLLNRFLNSSKPEVSSALLLLTSIATRDWPFFST